MFVVPNPKMGKGCTKSLKAVFDLVGNTPIEMSAAVFDRIDRCFADVDVFPRDEFSRRYEGVRAGARCEALEQAHSARRDRVHLHRDTSARQRRG